MPARSRSPSIAPSAGPCTAVPKRTKYVLDGRVQELLREKYDTRVRGRVAEIAAELHWPKSAVTRAAHAWDSAGPGPKTAAHGRRRK